MTASTTSCACNPCHATTCSCGSTAGSEPSTRSGAAPCCCGSNCGCAQCDCPPNCGCAA